MREILFRGKRKDDGEWVYGDFIHRQIWASSLTIIRESDDGFDNYEECEVAPDSVGQYTGLNERSGVDCIKVNGYKIFEDDIVRVLYTDWGSKEENDTRTLEEYLQDKGSIGVVKRTEYGEWRIQINDCLYPIDCGKYGYIEIIGNIHDNPELLKRN